jgi:hypothetical protein
MDSSITSCEFEWRNILLLRKLIGNSDLDRFVALQSVFVWVCFMLISSTEAATCKGYFEVPKT